MCVRNPTKQYAYNSARLAYTLDAYSALRILLTWSGTVRLILNSRQTVVEIGENETVFTAAFVKQAKLILTQ